MSLLRRLNTQTIRAVIFDHDGTLVNSEPVHYSCWQKVLATFGATLSAETYNINLSGKPSIQSAHWLIEHFTLGSVSAQQMFEEKTTLLHHWLTNHAFPLKEGANDLLNHLHPRVPLAIASGAGRMEVERSVEAHQLRKYFKTLCTKDDVKHNKPAADVYLLAAEELGVEPSECIAIEDSDTGQAAAEAAGMHCFRLTDNTRARASKHWTPISQLSDLLK